MDLRLKGKSVLITGGSKGIGLAAAKAFAAEGCRVHLAARDRVRLDTAKAELGGDVSVHAVALRDGGALRRLAAECAEVDILEKLGDESRWEELVGTGSFGQMIEPEQVADMVAFLASPRAGKLSGVMINLGA